MVNITPEQLQALVSTAVQAATSTAGDPFARRVKEFNVLNPTTFSGDGTPIEAMKWFHGIERKLRTLHYTTEQQRELVVHKLTGTTLEWR